MTAFLTAFVVAIVGLGGAALGARRERHRWLTEQRLDAYSELVGLPRPAPGETFEDVLASGEVRRVLGKVMLLATPKVAEAADLYFDALGDLGHGRISQEHTGACLQVFILAAQRELKIRGRTPPRLPIPSVSQPQPGPPTPNAT